MPTHEILKAIFDSPTARRTREQIVRALVKQVEAIIKPARSLFENLLESGLKSAMEHLDESKREESEATTVLELGEDMSQMADEVKEFLDLNWSYEEILWILKILEAKYKDDSRFQELGLTLNEFILTIISQLELDGPRELIEGYKFLKLSLIEVGEGEFYIEAEVV